MTDRRDPFVLVEPRNEQANPNGPRPDLRRNREALEEYPLDALRMVGTITTPAGTFALVKAPDGVVHRVAVHAHMGQNYGRSEEHTSELQSLMRISSAVFRLKKKKKSH